jgi:hypothetical protein
LKIKVLTDFVSSEVYCLVHDDCLLAVSTYGGRGKAVLCACKGTDLLHEGSTLMTESKYSQNVSWGRGAKTPPTALIDKLIV